MSTLPPAASTLGRAAKETLENLLFATSAIKDKFGGSPNTYAVLDGASIPDLLAKLYDTKFCSEFACLYRGELEPDLAAVAPYLVRLKVGEPITGWLLDNGWGRHWGVFALSREDLKTVRKHFRTFLMVQNPEGKRLYFRFYDPRVLPLFLPTCNAFQIKRIFGPITRFICECAQGGEALLQQFDGTRIIEEIFDLRGGRTRPVEPASARPVGNSSPASEADIRSLLLHIRQEQMDALATPRRAQLPNKIANYLRSECPKQVQAKGDAELEDFAREQIKRASRHGIMVEWDLCRFSWLAALHGPHFDDECDWAGRVLADMDRAGTERMDMLEQYQTNYIEPVFTPI